MITPKFEGSERDQARAWVKRLKDSHSAADREAFEQWLAKDPAHRHAYDMVSASYSDAGVLRMSDVGRRRDLEGAFRKRRFGLGGALAAASAAALLLLGGYELRQGLRPMPLESVMLSSGAQARNIKLADGSALEMAPSSEVRIELGRSARVAELRRGRIRLSIKREGRPFRIVAGARSAEANGGNFEARVIDGEGMITAGEGPEARLTGAGRSGSLDHAIAGQAMEFSAEPLGKAIARINAVRAGPQIEIDPELSSLRVTGVFQQGSSNEIAQSLAVAFGLELSTTSAGTLRLAR